MKSITCFPTKVIIKKVFLFFITVCFLAYSLTIYAIKAISDSNNDDYNIESELEPAEASGCTGTYIPSSWTVDTSYQGTNINYVCYIHNWTLYNNKIYDHGVKIGHYDTGHFMDNQWTVAHFHMDGDPFNTHYVF